VTCWQAYHSWHRRRYGIVRHRRAVSLELLFSRMVSIMGPHRYARAGLRRPWRWEANSVDVQVIVLCHDKRGLAFLRAGGWRAGHLEHYVPALLMKTGALRNARQHYAGNCAAGVLAPCAAPIAIVNMATSSSPQHKRTKHRVAAAPFTPPLPSLRSAPPASPSASMPGECRGL